MRIVKDGCGKKLSYDPFVICSKPFTHEVYQKYEDSLYARRSCFRRCNDHALIKYEGATIMDHSPTRGASVNKKAILRDFPDADMKDEWFLEFVD